MSANARVAVVGVGHWGQRIARNFSELGALHAVVDIRELHARQIAEKYGTLSTSFQAAIENPAVDAIVLATPPGSHFRLAKAALLAEKHVFVEKPFCLDLDDARELVEIAERRDRRLMVGHLILHHPAYRQAKSMVESGRVGTVKYIYSNRLSFGHFKGAEDALWDLAVHDIAMLLDIAGRSPSATQGFASSLLSPDQFDSVHLQLKFSDVLAGHIFASRVHPFKEQRLTIVGDKGTLVFDDAAEPARKLLRYERPLPTDDRQTIGTLVAGEPVAYPRDEPLYLECAHFLRCVVTGETPMTDGRNGLRVTEVMAAAAELLGRGPLKHHAQRAALAGAGLSVAQ